MMYDPTKVLEKDIEKYLRDKVKAVGGRAYKWTSPGNIGVPDRIILLPGCRIVFAELKAPGKKPTVKQNQQIKAIRSWGFTAVVIDTYEKVDALISNIHLIQPVAPANVEFINALKAAGVMTG